MPIFNYEPKYTYNSQIINSKSNPTDQEKVSRMNHIISQNNDLNFTITIEQATDLQRLDSALTFNELNVT